MRTGAAMGASQTCGRITSLPWAWWAEIFTTPTSSRRGLWMRLRSAIRASRSGCTCFTRLFTLVDTASIHYTHLLLCCQLMFVVAYSTYCWWPKSGAHRSPPEWEQWPGQPDYKSALHVLDNGTASNPQHWLSSFCLCPAKSVIDKPCMTNIYLHF